MLGLRPVDWRLALLAASVRLAVLITTTYLDKLLVDYDTSKYITTAPVELSYYLPTTLLGGGDRPTDLASHHHGASYHIPHNISSTPSFAPPHTSLLHGWLVWDGVFFADIAARGYQYEQYYAFFPLLPSTFCNDAL